MQEFDQQDWRLLVEAGSLPYIQSLEEQLESENIKVYIVDSNTYSFPSLASFRLFVPCADLERAQRIKDENSDYLREE